MRTEDDVEWLYEHGWNFKIVLSEEFMGNFKNKRESSVKYRMWEPDRGEPRVSSVGSRNESIKSMNATAYEIRRDETPGPH